MISLFKVFMAPEASENVSKVLQSGMITQSSQVEVFEKKLQEYFNYPYILTLNSATSGLTLALRMFDLNDGDEVLSTPLTCFATNAPILANRLKIKWVDVDPNTCNIDLEDLKRKITEKTKAVVFVHWAGSPVDLDKIEDIKKYAKHEYGVDLKILEDCAHSFGAVYKGKKIGTHGNYCVFSLQAIKHLTTADGGLIFLPDEKSYERAKLLRWYGISREKRSGKGKDFRLEEDISEWGYKFHMNDVNASIGLSNLPYMENNLSIVRRNADYYEKNLSKLKNVKLFKTVEGSISSHWIYSIKVSNKKSFMECMNECNVMVSQVHKRNDTNSCMSEFKEDLPNVTELEKYLVSIPVGWWVTETDAKYIVEVIAKWDNSLEQPVRELSRSESDYESYTNLMKQLSECEKCTFEEYKTYCNNKSDNVIILVLEEHNNVVATAKIVIEDRLYDNIGYIQDVVVDKDNRDKGYGKILVKKLMKIARNRGCYKVVLGCKGYLEGFYQKCGFVDEGFQMVHRFK